MKKILLTVLLAVSSLMGVFAQSYTGDQAKRGYAIFSDKVTFIFDENIYGVRPERVFVTGDFRGWDASTEVGEWELKKVGEQWMLTFDNVDESVIKPNTGFKFRINNEGQWLDPTDQSPNVKGGNLIYEMDRVVAGLTAEIRKSNLIWATISGVKRSFNPADYIIKDAQGNEIKVVGVLPNESTTTLIVPEKDLDIRRVYYLEIPSQKLRAACSYDGWFREVYSTKELGANIDNGVTSIRVFAPRAEQVKLYLYKGANDTEAYQTFNMTVDNDGVWETIINEDLHGVYYDFTVHGSTDPGNFFYETKPVHINDPYARVSDDTFGKCRIWHRTKAATPLKGGVPKMEDVISYEVHVQDFTDNLPLPDSLKGTIRGMITPGLRNKNGEKVGFDYLVDLGINVVHLMPVQEYLHFPTDDWYESFKDDPYMIEQGIAHENYQWGYRTSFAMAVESRYRVKGAELGSERDDMRDLVQAFHDKGIAVIIDIVPNHTAEDMDGKQFLFNFNGFDKQYYYRTKNFEHIGAYGNEVKTENRPMTQRWLIDQVKYFIDEFGIDGVRVDIAGQMDQQTLTAFWDAIGRDKIVYGEPWIASNDPDYEANPDWDWYKEDSPICYFQDESRSSYKGPVFQLQDPKNDRGWAGGKYSEREGVMRGLTCTCKDDKNPNSGISYLDIHDNFALADQFGRNFDGRDSVYENEYKIAVTLLYTTLGPIVTHGGSEIMRSKAHAPLREEVRTTKAGYNAYMHGYRDTYNHRTANTFVWEQVGQKPTGTNFNDYDNMYKFWRGWNTFRKSEYGKVFRQGEAVPEGYYKWFLPQPGSALGYLVDDKVLVLINAGHEPIDFENVELPKGKWQLVGTSDAINIKGVKSKNKTTKVKAGVNKVTVEPLSQYVWIKK